MRVRHIKAICFSNETLKSDKVLILHCNKKATSITSSKLIYLFSNKKTVCESK